MNIASFLFGKSPAARSVISEPPPNADWRHVRPKPHQPAVRARRAEADCLVTTSQGRLNARGGKDYIVTYDFDDHAVVRGDIFERTYESMDGGLYRKRSDIVLRYFTLDRAVLVETLEGRQRAEPGDWIMQGLTGELWPVPRAKAFEKYDPV